MNNSFLIDAEHRYKAELFDRVVPFWLEISQDEKHGGYFSCLTRKGEVYDTDKFIWLQSRQVWLFSMLCNRVDKRSDWLECAEQGARFLLKNGHDGEYNWYFSLDREGRPLIQPYNIFTYTFAAMAFGQLHLATGEQIYADATLKTWKRILDRRDNPKGQWNKSVPGTRRLKNFALPMILSNLALEIEHLLDPEEVSGITEEVIREVMKTFYRPDLDLVVENVTEENELHNSFDGRLITPGHAIEAMWFMMDLSESLNRPELSEKAVRLAIRMLEYGWDREYGGIYYFLDREGHPPQQLEWSQKLWWVHIEVLVALLKGYRLTGSKECLKWFKTVDRYCWENFRDPEYAEWFGYRNRKGDLNLSLKGGKWKGCFHVPRGLFQCWNTLQKINKSSGPEPSPEHGSASPN